MSQAAFQLRPARSRRFGFGLVELLVIIAVVLFIAILLLPTFRSARETSNLTACRNNLAQIGVATANYAADSHDYLPPWRGQSLSPFRQNNILAEFGCTAYYDGWIPPGAVEANRVADPSTGTMRLLVSGYLGKWNWSVNGAPQPPTLGAFLDGFPAHSAAAQFPQTDTRFFPARWCPGQRQTLSPAGSLIGSDYLFNPHWAYLSAASLSAFNARSRANNSLPTTPLTGWYAKLTSYPKFAALACDMIYNSASLNHPGPDGTACFNMLYADGHVQWVRDSLVIRGFNQDPALAPLGGDQGALSATLPPAARGALGASVQGPNSPDNQLWLLDDYLDLLETEAAGQDPLAYMIYTGRWNPGDSLQPRPLQHREVHAKGFDSPVPGSNLREKAVVNLY